MTKQIRKISGEYLRKYIKGTVTSAKIILALEQQGYTVVCYNAVSNNEDVTDLTELLGITEYIRNSKGFTYADSNNRIVFFNEDLSEEERVLVLLHEQGHILCRHFSEGSVLGIDVVHEHEANEFVHYVLYVPKINIRIVVSCICLIILLTSALLINHNITQIKTKDVFYVTSSGHKYHKADCIYIKDKTNIRILTDDEYAIGAYEPCKVCQPDE